MPEFADFFDSHLLKLYTNQSKRFNNIPIVFITMSST